MRRVWFLAFAESGPGMRGGWSQCVDCDGFGIDAIVVSHRSVQNSLPAFLIEKCADRAHDLMEYDDDEVLWAPPVV